MFCPVLSTQGYSINLPGQLFHTLTGEVFDHENKGHQVFLKNYLSKSYIGFLEQAATHMQKKDREDFIKVIRFCQWQSATVDTSYRANGLMLAALSEPLDGSFEQRYREADNLLKQRIKEGRGLKYLKWCSEKETGDSPLSTLSGCIYDRVENGSECASSGIKDLQKMRDKLNFYKRLRSLRNQLCQQYLDNGMKLPFTAQLEPDFNVVFEHDGKQPQAVWESLSEEGSKLLANPGNQNLFKQISKQALTLDIPGLEESWV